MADQGIDWGQVLGQTLVSLGPVLERQRTLRRQNDAARQGLLDRQRRQQEADSRVGREIESVRGSMPDEERARLNEDFMLAVQRARANAGTARVPGASDRFQADAARADAGTLDYGRDFADLMARIDAPGLQRRGERESAARAGVDLEGVARDAAADDWLMRFRMANRQPSPWAPLIAALGGAAIEGLGGRSPAPPDDGLTEIDLSTLPKRRQMRPSIQEMLLPLPSFGGRP